MENTFESWALVELFGHNKIAGKVTEHKFGNTSMLRIDVPAVNDLPGFTKFVNTTSVYAINPLTEEDATAYAKILKVAPIDKWDMNQIFQNRIDELIHKGSLKKPELAKPEPSDDDDYTYNERF